MKRVLLRDGKLLLEGRYYNVSHGAVAIVAVITPEVDWAAYIGATADKRSEESTVEFAARFGAKLSEHDARHFFPAITLPYRL